MKNLLIIAACLLTLASCNSSGSTETTEAAAADTTATAPVAEPAVAQGMCYLIAEGKDSTTLSLTIAADGTVTGSYDWAPWEKDGAHGTITGKQEGDLFKVTYDYVIEGSNQQEEKVFKLTGDQIQEGEGELTEGEGGILKIKDASKLTWRPMTKVACK
ncbi:MAG: hypothetical protein IT258_04360 [Saprospiraceae bacterium]|nr:hypothetical protein [Saprospiraceae bacterium]